MTRKESTERNHGANFTRKGEIRFCEMQKNITTEYTEFTETFFSVHSVDSVVKLEFTHKIIHSPLQGF